MPIARKLFVFLLICAIVAPPPFLSPRAFAQNAPAATNDPESFITQAGMSYYNLRMAGLGRLQCSINPDWNALLADQRKIDPEAADDTIRIFSTLHFMVTVDQDGRTLLTHDDIVTNSGRVAQAMEQIVSGMENTTYGFFSTWVLYALASPFPDPATAVGLRIESTGGQYRLSYREGSGEMVIDLGRDFAIHDMGLTNGDFQTVTEPVFKPTDNGFVLESYSFRAWNRSAPTAPDYRVHVSIVYQQVEGFQLPQRLDIGGSAAGAPFSFSMLLSGCQVAHNDTGSV